MRKHLQWHPAWSVFVLSAASLFSFTCSQKEKKPPVEIEIQSWLTLPDRSLEFKLQQPGVISFLDNSVFPTIKIDSAQKFQQIDGFGFTLTGGSAQLINALSQPRQDSLLRKLFLTEGDGIGISYLRVSIGASDLDDHVFSYDDLPTGATDPSLQKFNLQNDQKNLIPILKKIIALNPEMKIMGSPWSAPSWMKTNGGTNGGSLKKEFYPTYANYFVRYIQAMEKEGIAIHTITIQNEPENPNNNPSMAMTAMEQAEFIRDHLGPAFRSANVKTKIVLFDHNCDHPEYPISILADERARQFVDGSAFHLYSGDIKALSKVHEAAPDKNIYFTEQWASGDGDFGGDLKWHVENLIVGAMRHWSRTVLEWNLAADSAFHPHTEDGGCDRCLGALTIDKTISRNVPYYIIAHASKFVRPGSVRIGSNEIDGLPNVAFKTAKGETVLIVLNSKETSQDLTISFYGWAATTSLAAGAVCTYVWK
jgi:glucosylceramidase